VSALFPRLNEKLPGGLSTAELWAEQDRQDAEEREALIRRCQEQEQKNHWF